MLKKQKAFTIIEIIMVIVISAIVMVMIAPALTKQKKYRGMTEKVVCIPGERIVIANSLGSGTLHGEFKLPPGINTFYLTLTGGGAGGSAACYWLPRNKNSNENKNEYNKYLAKNAHKVCNDAGAGGNGANFLYRENVDLSEDVESYDQLTIEYFIGNGGLAGTSLISADNNQYKSAYQTGARNTSNPWDTSEYKANNGAASTIKIYRNDESGSLRTYRVNGGNAATKMSVNGVADKDKLARDELYCMRNDNNCIGSIPPEFFYKSIMGPDSNGIYNRALPINVNYADDNSDGDDGKKGQRGEPSSIFYPGLGGGSAFGIGSYGSGGHGGLDSRAKSYDYVTGSAQNRRNGEHGMGGIMIIEYESKCQTSKKE